MTLVVEVAPDSLPADEPVWEELPGVRGYSFDRGRESELEQFYAGSCEVTLTAGDWFADLKLGRRLRIRHVFDGFYAAGSYVDHDGEAYVALVDTDEEPGTGDEWELDDWQSREVLADSPLSYYELLETSGTVADDIGSLANDATIFNTPTLGVTGPIPSVEPNLAMTFAAASSESVIAPDHAALDVGDSFTLEAWVKANAVAAHGGIVALGSGAPYLRLNPTGKVEILKSQVLMMGESTIEVDDNAWHHVVWTKNGATSVIYIDGVDRTGAVTDTTFSTSASGVWIGQQGVGSAEFVNASIGRVAVYDGALTAARVAAHFARDSDEWAEPTDPSYPRFTGTVTAKRRAWDLSGNDAVVRLRVADGFKAAQDAKLPNWPSYPDMVAFDQPLFHYRLDEQFPSSVLTAQVGSDGVYAVKDDPALPDPDNYQVPGAIVGDPSTRLGFTRSDPGPATTASVLLEIMEGLKVLGAFTLECWFERTDGDEGGLMEIILTETESNEINLYVTSGDKLGALVRVDATSVTLTGTTTLAEDTVYHGAVTWDGTTARLYVNGVEEDSEAIAGPMIPASPTVSGHIGFSNALDFSGYIDEAAAYEHALTADRILAHYQAGTIAGINTQASGERVEALLDRVGSYDPDRKISAGTVDVGPRRFVGQSILDEIRLVEQSEDGVFFYAADGHAVFRHRNWRNEVQWVAVSGSPTGGSFTLTFAGQTTAGIARNALAATVQAALEALSNIAPGDIIVTQQGLGGPAGVTSQQEVKFAGAYEGVDVAQMTINGAGLTGGSPVVSVTTFPGDVEATFGTVGDALGLRDPEPVEDDALLVNAWTVTSEGDDSGPQTASDTDSIEEHGEHGQTRETILTSSADRLALAEHLLERTAEQSERVTSFTVLPYRSDEVAQAALALELTDRVLIDFVPEVGDPVSQESYIEKVSEVCTASPSNWEITFAISAR